MKATKTIAMLLAMGMFLGLGASAQAAAIVYESMSYAAGAGVLHGKTADAGLGAWWLNDSNAGQIAAGSMTYTDANSKVLPVTGNRFETVSGFNDLGHASIDITTGGWADANKDGGKLNAKGAEIWFSMLARVQGGYHNKFQIEFTDSGNGYTGWANGPGYFAVGAEVGNDKKWEIFGDNDDDDEDQNATSTVSAAADTFILGRITTDASGNSTMGVWFNPLLDTAPTGSGDVSITVPANDDGSVTQFDAVGYRHQKWESPNLLDEIRMGESFNSVVGKSDASPIPEPATMAALGLAVCGLGGYVRRRRKA